MSKIIIRVPPYEGEYEFPSETLIGTEWRWIKKISGYMPLTIQEGIDGGDPDLTYAFAVIALARAGRIQNAQAVRVAEELAAHPYDGEVVALVPEEDEANPPAEPAATPGTETQKQSSGESSSSTSDHQGNGQRTTGPQDSQRSATFDRLTSVP